MNLNNSEDVRSKEGTGRSRKFRVGILLIVLVGSVLAGGAIVSTRAAGWSHGGRGHHEQFSHDPELARERAEFAASWVLGRIDATDEQQEQVKAIIGRSVDDLTALAEQHRQSREAWVAELSKPTIDLHGVGAASAERARNSRCRERASRGSTRRCRGSTDARAAYRAHRDGRALSQPLARGVMLPRVWRAGESRRGKTHLDDRG